jgi:hypothetical protein
MVRALGIATVLVLSLAIGGCSAGAGDTGSTPRPSRVAGGTGGSSDVGNGRPQVTYDGLMVRRRMAIALRLPSGADITAPPDDLALAASRQHLTLSTIAVTALDPAMLERLAPDLVVALPAGTTRADAGKLVASAFRDGRSVRKVGRDLEVVPVLVHDLRFTVRTARPAAVARAIAREGILSDALGNYTTTLDSHTLRIAYTGPLLSDHLVQSVRTGIARPAHVASGTVTVSPRSTTGVGVDMSKEPAPAPPAITTSPGHRHGTLDGASDPVATSSAATTSPRSHLWADLLAASVVLALVVSVVRFLTVELRQAADHR